MPFHAEPMFPGDLFDTTARVAADAPASPGFSGSKPSPTWDQFLELGWQAVLIAEAHGGAGASLGDVAAIAEAAGRHALPAPLVARCAVVPTLLAGIAGQASAAALLNDIAMGKASVCPVLDLASGVLGARSQGERVVLDGTLRGIDLSEPATHLLFVAPLDGAPALFLAPRAALSGSVRDYLGVDGRQTTDITLNALELPAASVLLRGDGVQPLVDHAQAVGALLCCAQMIGAIGAMIEQTIDYLGMRQQFGVALATFQALRHKVVEMYVAYENARGMVRQQLVAIDGAAAGTLSAATLRDVALVKFYLSVTGRTAAESAIQLHCGIGMSRELPAARLAMHTLACSQQWGDRFTLLDRLAAEPALH
ncbi:acyl-CoA dehydrogenase family protein [soil metagenome]